MGLAKVRSGSGEPRNRGRGRIKDGGKGFGSLLASEAWARRASSWMALLGLRHRNRNGRAGVGFASLAWSGSPASVGEALFLERRVAVLRYATKTQWVLFCD